MRGAGRRQSVPPEAIESPRSQVGIPHGMLDLLVAQVLPDRPGVVPIVRQLEPAGVAQHVGMDRERETRLLPGPGSSAPRML